MTPARDEFLQSERDRLPLRSKSAEFEGLVEEVVVELEVRGHVSSVTHHVRMLGETGGMGRQLRANFQPSSAKSRALTGDWQSEHRTLASEFGI